jgi:putative Holliday junction resolvase
MRCLAVDPGGARLGFAVGDTELGIATPLAVIRVTGSEQTVEAIVDQVARHQAELVVIGLPTSADGDETPACRRSRSLASALAERGLKTRLQPEHLSTDEARRRTRGLTDNRRRPVDDIAASVILEEFFAGQVAGDERS